jgi:hypothetical protein
MLIFEGISLLAGLYALIKGNFKWFNNKIIQGTRARIIGGILLLPTSLHVLLTAVIGPEQSSSLYVARLLILISVIGAAVLLAVTAPDTGEFITPSSSNLMSILDSVSKSKQVDEKIYTGLTAQDTCHFCHKTVTERSGGIAVFQSSGSDMFDLLNQMAARKFVCPSCSSVFCLDCGNKKGENLGTGSTHCPKCGTKVL